jgi:hypothetical protein
MKLPVWANINFDFNQQKIKKELLSNNIFDKGVVATTDYNDEGRSRWDPNGDIFPEEIFKKNKLIHHYKQKNGERELIKGQYNTFQMLNLTYLPEKEITKQQSWEGSLEKKDKRPLWIKYRQPWSWREDLNIPYTKKIIESLPIEYVLTVRCILQEPPSIGVVHKDNGPITNKDFFDSGFCSLTLNIADGGANLWAQSYKTEKKFKIDESKYKAWHFDDACLHCTSEVKSRRIQLRVFAKLNKPYTEILDLKNAEY